MTTIAYRDGTLAADTCVTCSSGRRLPGTHSKICSNEHGWLFGAAGTIADIARLRQWFSTYTGDKRLKGPPGGSYDALLISPKGACLYLELGAIWDAPTDAPFHAVGSGAALAIGAMAHGATAQEAVATAILYDEGSGGRVDHLSIT